MAAKPVPIPILATCLAWTMALLPQAALAQPRQAWTLRGSFRVRYEALSGQFRPGFASRDDLVSLRTTIFAQYAAGHIRIATELDDARAYGAGRQSAVSANDVDALELAQAYVAADVPLAAGAGLSLQAGRFIMRLGSRRRSDEEEYRNTMVGFSGLRADLRSRGGTSATLFYTLPQIHLPDDRPSVLANAVRIDRESFAFRFWGGMISRTRAWRNMSFDVFYSGLRERDSPGRPTRERRLHSLGARFVREPQAGKLDFAGEAVVQFGSIRAAPGVGARLDVFASYVHADLGYSFAGPLGLRLAAEYDRASGDGHGPAYGRFDPPFGIRRLDLAPTGIYSAIGRANIETPALRVDIAPGPRWDAYAIARALWAARATDSFSATGVRDPSGASGRYAGVQLDGRLRYWHNTDRLRAQANAALLLKRGLLRHAPNAPATGDTAYFAASLTATF